MGFDLTDEGDRERKGRRLRDGKAKREGFGLTVIVDHDGTKTPSSFYPCPSVGYAQFSIREAVGAYFIHLNIGYLGTTTIGIYSISDIYSTGASSSWIFYGPTHVELPALGDGLLRCGGKRRYDFSDHKRARDVRLRKIG
ncbi:hypothetical protein COCNU_07G013450 [Cocos nucifera]|uniref:Uncharacterized protein n=1 Tax=Cocos nucifera TaxID=13894 RepID=A0A8K0N5C4_COCNU|nr:hypothetical protein COCNU_07G013450 [Cocos nucifera]